MHLVLWKDTFLRKQINRSCKNYLRKQNPPSPKVYKKKKPWISSRLLAVRTGLEPATPCVTGMYSNQLNYRTWLFCECKDIGYFLYLQIFRQLFSKKVQIFLFGGQKPGVWKIFRWKEIKNSEKIWWFGKSALSLQRFSDEESVKLGLSYGVMVALQFLVLPVLVRVRIRQLKERWSSALFFCLDERVWGNQYVLFWQEGGVRQRTTGYRRSSKLARKVPGTTPSAWIYRAFCGKNFAQSAVI